MKKNLYLLALFLLPTLVFFSLSRLWQEAETPSETPPVPSQAPQYREGPKDRNSGPGAPVAPEKRYKGLPGAAMLEKREASVATAAQLEVTVIDEETGAPIPGVKVAILDWATRAEQMSEETNLEGRASLQLGTGQYWLTADHPDYLSGETGVSMDPAKARIGKTLALKGVSRVTGTLRNQNGVAVADARILFRRGGNPLEKGSHLSTNTLRDGSFELSATPGTYEVQVVKLPSEKILESPVVVPTAGPLKLTLEEEANPVRLFGRVVGEDGAPVEDANVTVKLRSRSFPRLVGQSKTNGRGRFEMRLPRGAAIISVKARGYREHQEERMLSRNTRRRVILKKSKVFSVQVYDSEGQRVKNPVILGRSVGTGELVVRSLSSKTAEGLEHPFYSTEYPFEIHATALGEGLGFTETRVIGEYQAVIELHSSGQGRLSGYVADATGNPIRDFTISLEQEGSQKAATRVFSEEGRFNFKGIPTGSYAVAIAADQYRSQRRAVDVREGVPDFVEVVLFK